MTSAQQDETPKNPHQRGLTMRRSLTSLETLGSVIYLADLGTSLLRRFERLGSLLDINKAVVMLEGPVARTPDGHPDKPSQLNNLGISLVRHFERLDGHPDKPSRLNNLGNSLLSRFERLGDLDDLNQSVLRKSVLRFEAAVALTGFPTIPLGMGITDVMRRSQVVVVVVGDEPGKGVGAVVVDGHRVLLVGERNIVPVVLGVGSSGEGMEFPRQGVGIELLKRGTRRGMRLA
ncbi:hypothetical protein B0H14DRAFT_3646503 [Mycena olivaceomarginata]|nr:hypothetical protein B0H14DRAFT_3646503 [Mycena olivaceomarginata]